MFSKLASLISLIAFAAAAPQHQLPAAQFPAGVNPALCPGYPNCDNALLHNPQPQNHQAQQGQWNPQPQAGQWNPQPEAGQWNPQPQAGQWNAQPQAGQWDDHSGQWNPHQESGQWNAEPAHAQNWAAPTQTPYYQPAQPAYSAPSSNHLDSTGGDKYPAGVNPQSCPNYPYCDTSASGGHHAPAAPQVAPLPGYTERLYPAGVSAQQCPNFPYCS